MQRGRHRVLVPIARLGQGSHRLLPLLGLCGHDAEPLQVLPQTGLEAVDPQPFTGVVVEDPGLGDERCELAELLAVKGEVRPRWQDQM